MGQVEANFRSVFHLFFSNSHYWIIWMAPFVLAYILYFMGKVLDVRVELNQRMEKEKSLMEMLKGIVTNLVEGNLAVQIKQENLDGNQSLKDLSESLDTLRIKLLDDRQKEDRKKWVTEGLAHFGDILRNNDNLAKLCENFITELVKYLKFNQGSIFLPIEHDTEGKMLELMGCYAYDRKKFIHKTIELSEGLVGQCFLEKHPMILFDVPKNYLKITSGLGEANPDTLLIYPLKTADSVEGVIEVAGFGRPEDHILEFISQVCEDMASVLKNVTLAEHTKKLLELTQQQAEALQQKEEEMKQNIKDMQETMLEMLGGKSEV